MGDNLTKNNVVGSGGVRLHKDPSPTSGAGPDATQDHAVAFVAWRPCSLLKTGILPR